ncbi:hypothetical protein BJ912DRAFT_931283 [Pholiota molesta]|nr:hypothetical protein BJ912DRAFT_931283 [Pholiota molesta]
MNYEARRRAVLLVLYPRLAVSVEVVWTQTKETSGRKFENRKGSALDVGHKRYHQQEDRVSGIAYTEDMNRSSGLERRGKKMAVIEVGSEAEKISPCSKQNKKKLVWVINAARLLKIKMDPR